MKDMGLVTEDGQYDAERFYDLVVQKKNLFKEYSSIKG
jgi:hypothetical protein